MRVFTLMLVLGLNVLSSAAASAQQLPFTFKVETFREEEGPAAVFALKLEQPFLADEFEQSNFIRLKALDDGAYLIYPRETKFEQKHAEFFGRLRGSGKTKVQLSYEVVSERIDGTRQVDTRATEIEIEIPDEPSGSPEIFKQWARQQNAHFVDLLRYYPDESFFEYVVLQSEDRYGIKTPARTWRTFASREQTEANLYYLFSGGLAVQQSLQMQTLGQGPQRGDHNIHISSVKPPNLKSLDYDKLLESKSEQGIQPQPHELTRLVPIDQYFLQLNSIDAADELMALSVDWGESLLRTYTLSARRQHLRRKYEEQLGVSRDDLRTLFEQGAVSQLAVTGSDFFLMEGTDITLLLKVEQADRFQEVVERWGGRMREQFPGLIEREFNYRGHRVLVRYTSDRMASSFTIQTGQYVAISNSHVAIRKVIDTLTGRTDSLSSAGDYRYMTTVLPPSNRPEAGYMYASDAFLRRIVSPQFKIAEKRRLESFTNLVMLNNASLFYRLENGQSPESLSDLIDGRFVNPDKVVCPDGGAYAFDAQRDTCTSSLYNRIKYLTPIVELDVLKVSSDEKRQYDAYRSRYAGFWGQFFNPLGVRLTLGKDVKIESQVLPLQNGQLDRALRQMLDDQPQTLGTAGIASSAVLSLNLVPGRQSTAQMLRMIPGVQQALAADPTLTDLSWLGDRAAVHLCDNDVILEIDPTRLQNLKTMFQPTVFQQTLGAFALAATNQPIYVTIDVEDEAKALRLLENLSPRLFLEGGNLVGLPTELDAYRLPDYREHARYVLSYRLYALKIRLHMAVVGGRLVAATKPHVLEQVIDAVADGPEDEADPGREIAGHAQLRLNREAIDKLRDNLGLYWAEKARHASHRNIMPIYSLIKLYGVSIDEVNALADAKYGVTYFCPDGEYRYDAQRDVVYSTVYGNRQDPRQRLSINSDSSFGRFLDSLSEIQATLTLNDDGTLATVLIRRK